MGVMVKSIMEEAPEDIRLYLDEIAERLWTGHAAVMVGAGFSKNAKSSSPLIKGFPNWDQLGNTFYEKIYGRLPEGEHYLNVLKLADEVQAAFGRPALEQLIRSQIPDKEHKPSTLHIELLELPWVDIFTTNYDTLLERTCAKVTSQRYDIVINKEDLVFSERPRIIKLHGSLSAGTPFVVTEEDYRKYPQKFAPFVNTVQQALLENTLCLIGFSGDDPNFLKWIGWIRDNLGNENSPKIYMVGVFDMPDSKKKLLENCCNIVLIDMSLWPGVNNDHEKGLSYFLEYIRSKRKDNSRLEWPTTETSRCPKDDKDLLEQFEEIVVGWREQRELFPSWVIAPADIRDRLWNATEQWVEKVLSTELKGSLDIDFLYELNWRLEKSLCPIFSHWIERYEEIINSYNPFPDLILIEKVEYSPGNIDSNYQWEELQMKWLELNISLMRCYRENGMHDKWEAIDDRLKDLKDELNPTMIAKWYYERSLYALFMLDIAKVRMTLEEWPVNESLPFWEAKRAAILAELNNLAEAEEILERSLYLIRDQLNLMPLLPNYHLVSQEAYVMQLLQLVKTARSPWDFEKREELKEEFTERRNYLRQFRVDPWSDIKLFRIGLEKETVSKPVIEEKYEFDIGKVITNFRWEVDKEALKAYNFLRHSEEVGLPFQIANVASTKKIAEGAMKRISSYSPQWALITLLRLGDLKIVGGLFNREFISKMQVEHIDRLIIEYIEALQNTRTEIESGDEFREINFGIRLARVIPEIVSRLCVKCSEETRDELFYFIRDIYESEDGHKYDGVGKLLKRLMETWSFAKYYEMIPELLKFPILQTTSKAILRKLPEPFLIGNFYEERDDLPPIQISQDVVEKLIRGVESSGVEERLRSFARLSELYLFGLLNQEQEQCFGDSLWSRIDEQTGFPQGISGFRFWFFLILPHPHEVDPYQTFMSYIQKEGFPLQKGKDSITITRGDISICNDIIGATKSPFTSRGIDWSQEEALELLSRIIEWWDSDKDYLLRKGGVFFDIKEEFSDRFKNLVVLLTKVIIPRLSPQIDDSAKRELARLLKELHDYGIPCVSSTLVSVVVFPNEKDAIYSMLEDYIISMDKEKRSDAISGIYRILVMAKSGINISCPDYLWDYISQTIKWRREQGFKAACNVTKKIFTNMPELVPARFLDDILTGLKNLLDETSPEYSTHFGPIERRLAFRSFASNLAYCVYEYYKKNDLQIPEVIIRWKEVCQSPEEFWEIRKIWVNG